MKTIDQEILVALDRWPAAAPSSHGGVATAAVRGEMAVRRSYDTVREHLASMAEAPTPWVARRKVGRSQLYRLTYAGIEELERAKELSRG